MLRLLLGLLLTCFVGSHAWAQAACPNPNPNISAWTTLTGPPFKGIDSTPSVNCPLPAGGLNGAFSTIATAISAGTCPAGMTCVIPTGVAATDTANIQAAVSHDYADVLLLPGNYKTNADIVITNRNVSIRGYGNAATWGAGLGGSVSPYPSNTNVDCSAIPHASNNLGGCFVVKNQNAHFSGFRIFANSGSGENCIATGDSATVIDGGMVLDFCYVGVIIDTAVGTTTGFALNAFINHTYMPYSWQFGIYCNSSCTDFMFGPDIWMEVAGGQCGIGNNCTGLVSGKSAAVWTGSNAIHGRVSGNFFGDGSWCLYDHGSLDIAFVNNECGNSEALFLEGADQVQFAGNSGYWNFNDGSPAIAAFGTNFGIQITDNFFYPSAFKYGSCFKAYSGAVLSGALIANNYCNTNALYADTYSDSVYDPWINPHPVGGLTIGNTTGTFAAPDWQGGFDITLPLYHGSNTLPNPVYTSFGQKGTFSITQSPGGTDTIGTLGTQYLNSPASLSTTAYATDIYPWQTNSQGNIIFGAKTATITPNTNLLTGGNAMTSGWSNSNLTSFTTNSVADPIGTTTGAVAIENTAASTTHGVSQTLSGMSANTEYTCAVWFNRGTSNNRNMAFYITDASSNQGYVILFQDGTSGGNSGVGLVNWGLAATSGSWSRLYVQINTSAAPASLGLYLYKNPTIFYTGDGTSGGQFWGPTCRLGSAP